MALPNSHVGEITSCSAVFADRAFTEVMKLKWGHIGGPSSSMTGVLIKGAIKTQTYTERPREDTGE